MSPQPKTLFEQQEFAEKDHRSWLRLLTPERLDDTALNAAAVRELLFKIDSLASGPSECWQGPQGLLAKYLGRSIRSVGRYVRRCEALGLLMVRRVRGTDSTYRIDWDGVMRHGVKPQPRAAVDWAEIRQRRQRRYLGHTPDNHRTKCPGSPDRMSWDRGRKVRGPRTNCPASN